MGVQRPNSGSFRKNDPRSIGRRKLEFADYIGLETKEGKELIDCCLSIVRGQPVEIEAGKDEAGNDVVERHYPEHRDKVKAAQLLMAYYVGMPSRDINVNVAEAPGRKIDASLMKPRELASYVEGLRMIEAAASSQAEVDGEIVPDAPDQPKN